MKALERLALAVMALLTTAGAALQGARPQPVDTVVGHVTCSDTQRPARLAQVKLVRVPTAVDLKPAGAGQTSNYRDVAGNPVETSLDGSFTVRNVKPGLYYVVVDKEGYLLPLDQFSKKELASTDEATRMRVAKAVRPINVECGQTIREDVVLDRGASVSGTILYDDGTPASGVGIDLLVKGADGKWMRRENERYRNLSVTRAVDDYGHYRISGLPPGEYATEANLALNDHEETFGPMPGHPETMMSVEMTKTRFSLPLYSVDVMRMSNASGYLLGSGQARTGSDLVFPFAKLHRVGGQVLAKDGHV